MALLEVNNLTMNFPDKNLYNDAEFKIERGEHVGIIGQNGAGKSTLIKILTGELLPVQGKIDWQKGISYGFLDQYADIPNDATLVSFLHTAYKDLYAQEKTMTDLYTQYATTADEKLLNRASRIQDQLTAENFYELDTKINQVITGLGLDSIGNDHLIGEMSGGQRAKIILAKLLLENNDVLILDEPTNYLDVEHINWLEEFINNYENSVIVISHDFDFLEAITNTIIDISFGKITKYKGSFQQAIRQKEENADRQVREFNKQQEVIAKAKTFIAKNKAGTKSKQARSREKMLNRMDVIDRPDQQNRANFDFPYIESQSENTLVTHQLTVGYNGNPVLNPVTFSMSAGEKVAFQGFNGAGKSTLIKTLLEKIPAISGDSKLSPSAKINYFDQELIWDDDNKTPLQIFQNDFPLMEPKVIRSKLGAAGLSPENAMKPMHQLSGGEQTKVKIALMELDDSNFLVLDEPTNHLDATTKDALAKAIQKFPGSAIIVSHEQGFYKSWIDKELNIAELSLQDEGI